ncbi:MAG TPA: hypothetical protein VIU87_12445, partial [Mycobacterium sp.]
MTGGVFHVISVAGRAHDVTEQRSDKTVTEGDTPRVAHDRTNTWPGMSGGVSDSFAMINVAGLSLLPR